MGNQRIAAVRADSSAQRVVLTTVVVNGVSMQFLVDTGATTALRSARTTPNAPTCAIHPPSA